MKQITCDYCGKVKKEVSFTIGACSPKHAGKDWCMIFGTGKMACPDCYEKASAEGRKAVDNHIAAYS